MRALIVNADDFGQSPGVNRGVIEAQKNGIVTSASLMVRWPAAAQAAAYAIEHPALSLGLHIDLGEWAYRHDSWVRVYDVVPLEDADEVRKEIMRQLDTFRRLAGIDPTHIDSHQHVHRDEPVRSIASDLSHELGVPLRLFSTGIRYCGDFYGQTEEGSAYPEGIDTANLISIIKRLPHGTTELACHPGQEIDPDLDTQYLAERAQEVKALCDLGVRETLIREEITCLSFRDIPGRQ